MHRLLCPLLVGITLTTGLTRLAAQAVDVSEFSQLVGDYNLLTLGNANLSLINNDTEGPLAVGGNLTVGGDPLVNFSQFNTSSDPTLYVGGTLSISNGATLQLNNGYASLPGNAGTGTYPYLGSGTNYQPAGTTGYLHVNSSTPYSAMDPRINPAPSGWNLSSLQTQFDQISSDLAAASPTATPTVNGQTLTFSSVASGVTVFDLNAALLGTSNGQATYNGTPFTSLGFSIPTNGVFVVNLENAGGKTIFGSNVNFNALNGSQGSRLLWNVEANQGPGTAVTLGDGGQFYGAVLAPQINLANGTNEPLSGQVVADNITYSNAQLNFTAFTPPVNIPEPGWASLLLAGAGFAAGLARRRGRAALA